MGLTFSKEQVFHIQIASAVQFAYSLLIVCSLETSCMLCGLCFFVHPPEKDALASITICGFWGLQCFETSAYVPVASVRVVLNDV